MKIDRAYCLELEREVTAYEARKEFLLQNTYSKFHFLCSDPECRYSHPDGVKVSAPVHHKNPKVDKPKVSPYFKKFVKYPHIDTCEWVELEECLQMRDAASGISGKNNSKKLISSKFITKFTLPSITAKAL